MSIERMLAIALLASANPPAASDEELDPICRADLVVAGDLHTLSKTFVGQPGWYGDDEKFVYDVRIEQVLVGKAPRQLRFERLQHTDFNPAIDTFLLFFDTRTRPSPTLVAFDYRAIHDDKGSIVIPVLGVDDEDGSWLPDGYQALTHRISYAPAALWWALHNDRLKERAAAPDGRRWMQKYGGKWLPSRGILAGDIPRLLALRQRECAG